MEELKGIAKKMFTDTNIDMIKGIAPKILACAAVLAAVVVIVQLVIAIVSFLLELVGIVFMWLYTIACVLVSLAVIKFMYNHLGRLRKPVVNIVLGIAGLIFAVSLAGGHGDIVVVGVILGLISVFVIFINALRVLALLVAKGTTKAALALGASEETATDIGNFAGYATARVAGAVIVADVVGNVLNNIDTSPSIDTGSVDVVSATPDFTGSMSSAAMSMPDFTGSISSAATSMPDFTGGMSGAAMSTPDFTSGISNVASVGSVSNSVGVAAAAMTSSDMITPDFTVTSSGMIFDAQEQFAGMFQNNTLFDSNMQFSGRIDGNTIFDANNQLAGTIRDNVIYDSLQQEIGSIDDNGHVYDSLKQYVGKIKIG